MLFNKEDMRAIGVTEQDVRNRVKLGRYSAVATPNGSSQKKTNTTVDKLYIFPVLQPHLTIYS